MIVQIFNTLDLLNRCFKSNALDAGISFGDIKLSNLLLSFNNSNLPEIILTDYGTAGPNNYKYGGTSFYLPPDRANLLSPTGITEFLTGRICISRGLGCVYFVQNYTFF